MSTPTPAPARLPLDVVEHVAEPRDDGELYVDMRHFQRCRWHEWPYVTKEVRIG
jgi:hypothetical protein